MENRKFVGMLIIPVIALALLFAACGSSQKGPAAAEMDFNNLEITALQARNADYGEEGGAYWFSGAKTTLESGTYEILLLRQRSVNARDYEYMEFEIKTDNLDLFDDIGGFYPRIRTGETYVQYNGTKALMSGITSASADEWVTISVPISPAAGAILHENGDELRGVLPRVDSVLLRFICSDMENYNGKIYLRNFRFN